MNDFLAEELEFQRDMDELRNLVEKILYLTMSAESPQLKNMYFDVEVFGDDPAFTSVLMDRLMDEAEK